MVIDQEFSSLLGICRQLGKIRSVVAESSSHDKSNHRGLMIVSVSLALILVWPLSIAGYYKHTWDLEFILLEMYQWSMQHTTKLMNYLMNQ